MNNLLCVQVIKSPQDNALLAETFEGENFHEFRNLRAICESFLYEI